MTGTISVRAGSAKELRPGDTVEVTFEWSLAEAPRMLEARLVWFTKGKGTPDVAVIETQSASPAAIGDQRFRFKLPLAPYSFSGSLISLIWAVELVADDLAERWEFTMAPEGREIVLARASAPTLPQARDDSHARAR